MRILLFLLISFPAFAQLDTGTGADMACDENTIAGGGTFNCETLIISNPPTFTTPALPLLIKVRGTVDINASFDLSGGIGGPINPNFGFTVPGGPGGPGAGDGGGFDPGGTPTAGTDSSLSSGGPSSSSGTCGGGGGGAGMALIGNIGLPCTGGSAPGTAGDPVDPTEFSFSGILRGGFGGGAGGDSVNGDIGSGGGGGGAVHIIAGGTVTVNFNIFAKGGPGGATASDGGGGGGGSGGVIWIQTNDQIINLAGINADGGPGGASGTGGVGGSGEHGFVRLEDADGIIGGTLPSYVTKFSTVSAFSSSNSLESGISCGMIKPNDNQNVFQIAFGFAFILLMSFILKILSRSRLKI